MGSIWIFPHLALVAVCPESLSAIFKHVDSPEDKLRENVLGFLKKKVGRQSDSVTRPVASRFQVGHASELLSAVLAVLQVFPNKALLLVPAAAMERHVTDLIKVTEGDPEEGAENTEGRAERERTADLTC